MKAAANGRPRSAACALAALLAIVPAVPVVAETQAQPQADAHSAHHLQLDSRVMRTTADYQVPPVRLTRSDGSVVSLVDELDDGRPVVLDFIYTTCTAVCPLSSQTFSDLSQRLGAAHGVHLVSVSIDPEQDTPQRMRQYANRYDAGAQWSFYTGTLPASETVQKAFHVFRGAKMLHEPTTLVRLAPGKPWIRFDGFVTSQELLAELRDRSAVR